MYACHDCKMTLYGDGIQTYAAMFDGFEGAASRFLDAATAKDQTKSYVSLFEALNWAVALDVRTKELWAPRGRNWQPGWAWRDEVQGAHVLRGVRFARNAMHHDRAEVLELTEAGRSYPNQYPVEYSEWVWRPVSRLPTIKRRDENGEAFYIQEMEGRPVRSTLVGLHSGFGFLRSILEPSSPRA